MPHLRLVPSAWRVISRPWAGLCLVAVVALLAALSLAWLKFPTPWIPDEFSKILAGETFALGRLTNPPHPMAGYLDSMHVIHSPTYQSKYPPADGLLLGLGILVGGHPIAGVWIGFMLACTATAWMMRPWVGPRWSVLGGALAASHGLLVERFGASYVGGSAAMIGGALLFGALRRVIDHPRPSSAALLGLGLVILANSRPFEGLIASIPAAVVLAWWLIREARKHGIGSVARVIVPLAAVVGVGGGLTAAYQAAVTGSALVSPYLTAQATTGSQHILVGLRSATTPVGSRLDSVWLNMAALFTEVALWPMLFVLFLSLWWTARRPWFAFAWLTFGATLFAASLTLGAAERYLAPAYPLFFLLVVASMRHLRIGLRHQYRLMPLVVLIWLGQFEMTRGAFTLPRAETEWTAQQAALAAPLIRDDAQHLIIVGRPINLPRIPNWVHNAADIDQAKVVWAWEVGDTQPLRDYFQGRRAWRLDLSEKPLRLAPLPATLERTWRLWLHDTRAQVVRPDERPAEVRTVISNGGSELAHIELETGHAPVYAGKTYRVSFRARADAPRDIGVTVSEAHPPWGNLGLTETVALTTTWRQFDMVFEARADAPVSRVVFGLGGSAIAVDLHYDAERRQQGRAAPAPPAAVSVPDQLSRYRRNTEAPATPTARRTPPARNRPTHEE